MGDYRPNPFFTAEFARETEVQRYVGRLAEQGAERARQIARAEAFDTGDYHDSITSAVGVEKNEAVGRIIADDWKSLLLEKGTAVHRAVAALRRAAESLDARVESNRR